MSPLDFIPKTVLAALLGLTVLACGYLGWELTASRQQTAEARLETAQAHAQSVTRVAQAAAVAASAIQEYRAIESRVAAEAQKAQDEQIRKTADDNRRDAALGARVAGLQDAVSIAARALRASRGCAAEDPSAARQRETGARGLDLFAACAAEYRSLGVAAARAYAAGEQCQRTYDAAVSSTP